MKQDQILNQFKSAFLHTIPNMGLHEINEDWAEELLAQRYYSEFENLLEELHDNCPDISNNQYDQIMAASNEISDNICKDLHHELLACICGDFELIATYLIAGENDKYIAGMCLSYMEGEIPMLSIDPTDKSLQEVFKNFQLSVRISKLRDSAKHKGNL